MIRTLMIWAALALGACVSDPTAQPTIASQAEGSGACKVSDHRGLIGKQAVDIDRSLLPTSFRIICAGCAATADLRPDRLTIELNRANQVETVRCQ